MKRHPAALMEFRLSPTLRLIVSDMRPDVLREGELWVDWHGWELLRSLARGFDGMTASPAARPALRRSDVAAIVSETLEKAAAEVADAIMARGGPQ